LRSILIDEMELDDRAKNASRELGDALNAALKSDIRVRHAIDHLREIGFRPNLTLRLELTPNRPVNESDEDIELKLSEEDRRALQRMKIRFE
jgi:hypothetical protein